MLCKIETEKKGPGPRFHSIVKLWDLLLGDPSPGQGKAVYVPRQEVEEDGTGAVEVDSGAGLASLVSSAYLVAPPGAGFSGEGGGSVDDTSGARSARHARTADEASEGLEGDDTVCWYAVRRVFEPLRGG